MKIEIGGKRFTGFLEATAIIAIENLSNSFSMQLGIASGVDLPFGLGDECTITVDGECVLTGSIEIISGTGSYGQAALSIIGRDKTGDIVDSTSLHKKEYGIYREVGFL